MFFDPIYWLIIGVGALLGFGASALVKLQFSRAAKVTLRSGRTGRDIAQAILDAEGITDVGIVENPGFLSDHYNPMTKTLALSPQVYNGRTAAAAGVAAHEVGHALQHAHGYAPMWLRSVLVPVANIGSSIAPWLIIIGIFLGASASLPGEPVQPHLVAIIGVVLFGAATAFTLITVPVEFDASARAKRILMNMGLIQAGEEQAAVRGVLTAAGLTYVAAAVTSLLHLLYWAWRAGLLGGGRRA